MFWKRRVNLVTIRNKQNTKHCDKEKYEEDNYVVGIDGIVAI